MKFTLTNICAWTVFLLLNVRAAKAQDPVEYGNNPAAGKYITLNGASHYYETYGEGQPILFIHGNGTPSRAWKNQVPHFSKKYKVYIIDCRGRGKSQLGPDSLTYLQQAGDMAAFIRQLKLDSVNVVGNSDGGIISILMGIYYPKNIRKIVAFAANLEPDTTALFPESVKEIHQERVKADMMLKNKDTTKNWLVEQQRYRMMEFQPHVKAEELKKITIPVLVMSCDRDVIREEHTLFIYKNIPKASLCILPNEKHSLARLNPELYNATVERYLQSPYRAHGYRFQKL